MSLLFHNAALGDFVLTFPLMRALKPPVTVVSSWSKALLAARVVAGVKPMSIELFEFTRLHAPGGPTALSPAVREVFEGVDVVLSFVARANEPWAANVARLTPGAKVVFVEPRPPEVFGGHVQAWHRQQLAEQGLELVPKPAARRECRGGPVVVHPGSGGRDKCWPEERYRALMDALAASGREVKPVLGEAEAERWPLPWQQRWVEQYGAEVLTDLLALHALLSTASLYIGNDSGPTHLAAEMGVPTVALFGPSDPTAWAPQGEHVTLLAPPQPAGMEWLEVERVTEAVSAKMSGS